MKNLRILPFWSHLKFSAKRLLVFQEQLGDNPVAREEMGRRSKLKVLCETRWASRADCLSVFVDTFQVKQSETQDQSYYKLTLMLSSINTQVIVETLNQLSEEGDSKARALHASILKWDFIITLVALQHIFE